jgi:hypothetical protein
MRQRFRVRTKLVQSPPLLITESADAFEFICTQLEEDIQPRGYIERMFAADIACITWEIVRMRRCQAAILNSAFRPALKQLLEQLLRGTSLEDEAGDLAQRWFTDPEAKTELRRSSVNSTSTNPLLKRKPPGTLCRPLHSQQYGGRVGGASREGASPPHPISRELGATSTREFGPDHCRR